MQKWLKIFISIVAILGAYFFYKKMYVELKEDNEKYLMVKGIDEKVIEKLVKGKDLQVHYLAVKGKYAKHWDSLFNFVRNDSIYMTQEKELIIKRPSGVDSIFLQIDTIGIVSVYDSLKSELGNIPLKDIESLKYAPGHPKDSLVEFFINAGAVKKAPVFEIYDTKPLNPLRTKPKNRGGIPPLKIGSMQGPSVKGNWEY
jgi:hypothetical protein